MPTSSSGHYTHYDADVHTLRPVVAAAIFDSLHHPTTLLCAERSYPPQLRGQFELPGGKIEPGELPLNALSREIDEELSTGLEFGPPLLGPDQGWWPILNGRRMGVWLAEIGKNQPAPRVGESHQALVWVGLDHVMDLDWIEADVPIVQACIAAAKNISIGKTRTIKK